jgi:hypothetical protein
MQLTAHSNFFYIPAASNIHRHCRSQDIIAVANVFSCNPITPEIICKK